MSAAEDKREAFYLCHTNDTAICTKKIGACIAIFTKLQGFVKVY